MENNHLTKKEKYFLKKERKEQNHSRAVRQKKLKTVAIFIISAVLAVGLIAFGINSYLSRDVSGQGAGTPKIEISPQEYDAGTVSIKGEKVKNTFEIKNIGDVDLKIDRIWTSCMCTTARLRVGDETSSEFGMHSNSLFWSQKIAPGETGYLDVTFDQAFHGPQGTGQAVRTIYLSTNDPKNKKAEVGLSANIIP